MASGASQREGSERKLADASGRVRHTKKTQITQTKNVTYHKLKAVHKTHKTASSGNSKQTSEGEDGQGGVQGLSQMTKYDLKMALMYIQTFWKPIACQDQAHKPIETTRDHQYTYA